MRSANRRHVLALALSGVADAATVAAVDVLPTPAGAASTAGDGYWHTSGSQILDAAGNPVPIAGITGLPGQDYKTIVGAVTGLGYNTSAYPEAIWINDRVAPANRYKGNPTVVAMDVRNEPHTDWNGSADVLDSTPGSQSQWFSRIHRYSKANNLNWTYEPTPVSAHGAARSSNAARVRRSRSPDTTR